jgi:hypothetical protein
VTSKNYIDFGRTQQNTREFIIENQNAFQYSSGEYPELLTLFFRQSSQLQSKQSGTG